MTLTDFMKYQMQDQYRQ